IPPPKHRSIAKQSRSTTAASALRRSSRPKPHSSAIDRSCLAGASNRRFRTMGDARANLLQTAPLPSHPEELERTLCMSTRRRFMLQSAAVAAAPFISTRVTRALAQGSRKKLGFALCGLGGLSENQLAPALQKTQYCRLTGVITDTPEKATKWKTKYGIPDRNIYTYETMAKMAGNKDIDVVYIVTPNALHAEQTALSAKAGKHVFCEKPMEVSVEKCQQMIDVCKAEKRRLGVAYRCQFDPNHLECMRIG